MGRAVPTPGRNDNAMTGLGEFQGCGWADGTGSDNEIGGHADSLMVTVDLTRALLSNSCCQSF